MSLEIKIKFEDTITRLDNRIAEETDDEARHYWKEFKKRIEAMHDSYEEFESWTASQGVSL